MSTKFDMSWDEIKSSDNKVEYLNLKDGENRMRIVSNPSAIDVHWEKDTEGNNKRVICSGNSDCILCEHGSKVTSRFQLLAIDKSNWDGKTKSYRGDIGVKIVEVGKSVVNQIKTLAQDSEYGDPRNYDIRITKTGSGRDTRYTVIGSPTKSHLTDEEKAAVENAPKIAEVNKILDREEIMKLNLNILKNVDADFEGTSSTSDSNSDEDWDNF